jgi:transcriptional regulator
VDVLVLKILTRGPLHGYGIAKRLEEETEGVVELEDAALYQGLHRMAGRGWIEAEWGRSETGRRAKLYRLTGAGRRRLERETAGFRDFAAAVLKVLET